MADTSFASDTEAETEKAAITRMRAAWKTTFEMRDVDGIMAFYAPEIVLYDIMPPLKFEGPEVNRQNWVNFFGAFDDNIRVDADDTTIIIGGDLAVVHEFTRVSGTQKGQPFSAWTRETNVLRKADGRWLIAHAHTSFPVDLASQKACMALEPCTKEGADCQS